MATTSIVQLTADLGASTATGAVSQLLPSGTVLPFAGKNVPAGWLLCDGAEVSKEIYSELFLAVADTNGAGVYDTQVNPTTGSAYAAPTAGNFRLPDYRGLFLRGVGTASGGDTTTLGGHQGQKTAKNGLSSSVTVSGAKNQMNGGTGYMWENWSHSHGIGDPGHSHSFGPLFRDSNLGDNHMPPRGSNAPIGGHVGTSHNGTGIWTGGTDINHRHGWDFGAATFSASGNPSINGDNETRPTNRGINYIIKV